MKRIQTNKKPIVNEKTLLVTIDIGKETNAGYCRCPDKTVARSFMFSNTHEGFNHLWQTISGIAQAKQLDRIVVGFESTGSYAEPLMQFLHTKGVHLVQVNPMHSKRLRELGDNSPHKTDMKDPSVIADIIELGHALTVIMPEGAAAELRRLTQARERSLTRRTVLVNQVHNLVFVSFPEFLQVMRTVKTKSAHYILQHYPTAQDIVQAGLEQLTGDLKRISRGKLGLERAVKLYEAAQHSIGVREGRSSVVLEIQAMLVAIEGCECFIRRVEKEISWHLQQIPYSRVLLSMKGIGEITVAGLIGEAGDFSMFHTAAELMKHAGLNLFEISSGQHKGSRPITKRGRTLMRKLLFFAAMRTVRSGGIMHDPYQRYLHNGMSKIKALVAISRKLLGIMFALVRDCRTYQVHNNDLQVLKEVA
jgi:transposase